MTNTMKRQLLTLAAMTLLTACQNEFLPTDRTPVTVTANLPVNEVESRVALSLDADASNNPFVNVEWRNEGRKETFTVMTAVFGEAAIFTQTEGSSFFGTLPGDAADGIYYAFYPATHASSPAAVPFDLSSQTGGLDETKTYMYAKSADGTHFDFRHLTAIVYISFYGFSNEAFPVTITLQGSALTAKGTVDFIEDGSGPTYTASASATQSVTLDGLTTDDIYVYLPPMPEGSILQIKATASDGNSYGGTLIPNRDIVAGMFYIAAVTLSQPIVEDGSSLTAADLQTAVTTALEGGVRYLSIPGDLSEDQQKAVGTALRNWCGRLPGGVFVNASESGTVTLNLPDVTEVHEGTFGEIVTDGDRTISYALGVLELPNATQIGENAFDHQEFLRKVDAPKVTELESYSFDGCNQLADVNMPLLVTVGDAVFRGASISTLPGTPVTIGNDVFWSCDNLTEVNLTWTTSIGTGVFRLCDNLQSVTAPLLTAVPQWAFADCKNLTSLTFGRPMTEWGGQVLGSIDTEKITLTLHPEQQVLTGGDVNSRDSKWTIADDASTVTFGENQEFCGYTFKEIKPYGE